MPPATANSDEELARVHSLQYIAAVAHGTSRARPAGDQLSLEPGHGRTRAPLGGATWL